MPEDSNRLFQENMNKLLGLNIYNKIQKLMSVWARRDEKRLKLSLTEWYKDPLVSLFIQRDRAWKKKRMNEDFSVL